MMLKGKAIRIRGWGRDSDRLGRMMCCDLLVGRGGWVIFWLSCLFDVWFDWQGIKRSLVEQWSILIGGQRWRFAIVAGLNCVIWLGFTLFVYQEFWSSMVTRALIGIDGISGEIKYDPGLSEVAVLEWGLRRSWWPQIEIGDVGNRGVNQRESHFGWRPL